jgi:prepilin-type N-terminal cleavage/methylation domain-containing protein
MRNRKGVSLIEVLVALVLFGMIATVHTVATLRYGVRQRFAAVGAARSAAVAQSIDLFSSMPRASIAGAAGCADITTWPSFPHERCVTVTAVSGTVSRITIVITPDNPALEPTTVTVDRVTTNTTPPFS